VKRRKPSWPLAFKTSKIGGRIPPRGVTSEGVAVEVAVGARGAGCHIKMSRHLVATIHLKGFIDGVYSVVK